MSNIVLKDKDGVRNTYSNISSINIPDSNGGFVKYVVEPTLIEKVITANGEYPASADGADGFSKVVVNVEGGEAIPEYDGTVIIEKAESVLGLRRFKKEIDVSLSPVNDEEFYLDIEGVYLPNETEPLPFTKIQLNNADLTDLGASTTTQQLLLCDESGCMAIYQNGWAGSEVLDHCWLLSMDGSMTEDEARLVNITKCEDETAKAWLLANTEPVEDTSGEAETMTLKAGTYRFNDVLSINIDLTQELIFTTDDGEIQNQFTGIILEDSLEGQDGVIYQYMAYIYDGTPVPVCDNVNPWYPDVSSQTITIANSQTVDDTFGTWYIANTNYNEVNASPLATIEYNGQTIAQLNAGETATLKCKDLPMASDVVVKVNEPPIPDGYVKPEGTLEITLNNIEAHPIDCSQYAKVTVNTAEPLKISDPTVLDNITDGPWGVGGSVFLYVGETTDTYENGAYYLLEDTEK